MWTHQEYIFTLSLHIQVVALPQNFTQLSYCMNKRTEKQSRYTKKNVCLVFVHVFEEQLGHQVLCLKAAARMHEVNGLHAFGAH